MSTSRSSSGSPRPEGGARSISRPGSGRGSVLSASPGSAGGLSVAGVPASASPWDGLLSDLQCPVCLEVYQHPVILPCSHILCRNPCADQLLSHNFVRCPVCREHSFIGEDVSTLPRVIALESIIERYRRPPAAPEDDDEDDDKETGVLCQLCDKKQAHKLCLECNVSYCVRCLSISHPPKEPFNKHKLIRPQKPDPDAKEEEVEPRCLQHKVEVNVYCQDCQVLGCLLCADNSHPGHRILSLQDAFVMYKNTLQRNMYKLERAQELLASQHEEHQGQLHTFKDSCRARREQIEYACAQLVNEIRSKQNLFLSDLEYEETSKGRSLQNVCEAIEHQREAVHTLVDSAQHMTEEVDMCMFLQRIKPLLDKVCQTLPRLAPPSPLETNLNHKFVDLRKELAIIRNISYQTVASMPVLDQSNCWRSAHSVVVALCPPDICDVVDEYHVFYWQQSNPESKQMVVFRNPGEDRAMRRGTPPQPSLCLIHEDLVPDTTYVFSVCAHNAAGDSATSETLMCQTLGDTQKELKNSVSKPQIVKSNCRCYSNAIQLFIPNCCSDEGLVYYMLYRETGTACVWKSLSLCPSRDTHRVFGLESDTPYEIVVLVCQRGSNRCLMSELVSFHTDVTAAY